MRRLRPVGRNLEAGANGKVEDGFGQSDTRKSHIFTVELVGKNTYRIIVTELDGKTIITPVTTFVFDGVSTRDPGSGLTTTLERIGDRHWRETTLGDKETAIEDHVVSLDGKTTTVTRKGNGTSSGRPLDELFIYEQQPHH